MKLLTVALLALVAVPAVGAVAETAVQPAVSTVSYNVDSTTTCFSAVIGFVAAGCTTWHVTSPGRLTPGTTGAACTFSGNPSTNCYVITAMASLDTAPLGTLGILATVTQSYAGCHVAATGVSSTVGFSVANYILIAVDPGAQYCGGAIHWRVQTATLISFSQFVHNFEFYIPTQDNLNRLCNADTWTDQTSEPHSGGTTYPTYAPCTTPSVNVPDVAAEIDELRSNLCRPTGNHGHCELDIHGEIGVDILNDATDDDVLTVPPSTIDVGEIMVPANTDFQDWFSDWAPLIMGLFLLGLFFLSHMTGRGNYWTLGIAGLLLLISSVSNPALPVVAFDYASRIVLFFFAWYCIVIAGLQAKDWNDERHAKTGEEDEHPQET